METEYHLGGAMKEEDRQKVNYVKAELNNYYHMNDRMCQYNLQAYDLQARINKVTSGSPAKIPIGKSEHNPNWRSPLYEELEQLENKIDMLAFRRRQVDNFLAKLQPNDRQIIWDLHISENDKKQYRDYCYQVGMSVSTLQRYVNRLILKKW